MNDSGLPVVFLSDMPILYGSRVGAVITRLQNVRTAQVYYPLKYQVFKSMDKQKQLTQQLTMSTDGSCTDML